ncbi:MAG: FG-GAP repeat protein [Alphaproteobacteria bacterium]|nr:FG-GAP repeat protein [Alphaproteobacteria bacterium]
MALLALLLTGCQLVPTSELDPDGDGASWSEDCAPFDGAVSSGCEAPDDSDPDDSDPDDSDPDDSDPDDSGADDSGPVDADGDGFTADEDCDDADADVFPGAPERCDDGAVNDCDAPAGWADARCVALSGEISLPEQASLALRGAAETDGFGDIVAAAGDMDGDGRVDLAVGSEAFDNRAGIAAIYRRALGGTLAYDEGEALIEPSSHYDNLAVDMASAGDLDGDGRAELALCAETASLEASATGVAYLFSGPGLVGAVSAEDATARFYGLVSGDLQSCAVAAAGDVNGGGAGVLISAPGEDGASGANNAGQVYLFEGAQAGDVALDGAGLVLQGSGDLVKVGESLVGLGDIDGDGLDDLLIGGSDYDRSTFRLTGKAYLWTGGLSGLADVTDAEAIFTMGEGSGTVPPALAAPGDVDGDGHVDALLGCPSCAAAYVFRGPLSGALGPEHADLVLDGATSSEAGRAVAVVGDVDGDTLPDLLIGAPGYGGSAGRAYLVAGDATGTLLLSEALAVFSAEGSNLRLGQSVAGVGDVDGNGAPDLLLGAPGVDGFVGEAWLVLGAP